MMKRILTLALLLLTPSFAAMAADVPAVAPAPTPVTTPAAIPIPAPAPAPATMAVPEAPKPVVVRKIAPIAPKYLSIAVDHGVALTLDAPAASVFIANPDIADVQVMSPTSIMIFGKRTGNTTFMATDASGATLEQRTVNVTQDLSDLKREFALAFPGGKIRAEPVPNGIVLMGDAKDPATVTDAYKIAQRYVPAGGDIINRLHVVGSNQIQIRVRFAEVQRNIDNSLGIDWSNLGKIGGFTLGLATGPAALATATSVISTRPNNTALSLPNDVIGVNAHGKNFSVNSLIDALAQDGLITILAEPNLTAMSGETANFLAGGEFPIPIPQGNGTISIEFKNYGISLAFTPTLINDNRVSLHVKPEVSQLTTAGSITLDNIAVPALTTRRAETTVEVASGQSFAIAGLLDNSQAQTVNKFPLLGDLPILGALFRSDRFQNGQTELVIIITPYIVTPNGNQQLALPTDGFSPPSESDRLLDRRYSSSDPDARPMSGAPVAAPAADPVVPVSATSDAPGIELPAPPPAPVVPTPAPTAAPAELKPSISLPIKPARKSPANLTPGSSAPAGAGGFILE